MRRAACPGSFDPVTNGHLDIIERALKVVDHLVVAVADNPGKGPLFNTKQRVKLLETDLANNPKIKGKSWEVRPFSKLLMEFVEDVDARVIVRGLRAVSDFEYEFQMALMNRQLWDELETVFLAPDTQYSFLSASLVREIGSLGGDISEFVSPTVLARLKTKFPS